MFQLGRWESDIWKRIYQGGEGMVSGKGYVLEKTKDGD